MVGVVKWVDLKAGRGRIVLDGERESLVFDLADVVDVGPPAPGQRVAFERSGDSAVQVRMTSGVRRRP